MRSTIACLLLLFSAKALAGLVEDYSQYLNGQAPLSEGVIQEMFAQYNAEFKSDHSIKLFQAPKGEESRRAVFAQSIRDMIKHNSDNTKTWKMGVNSFTDMTGEEFAQYYNIVKKDQVCTVAPPPGTLTMAEAQKLGFAPPSWDWRDFGAVTPVKNQGKCGSCWTFSTVGVIESHFMMKYGQFRNMSEQQLVDCSQAFDTFGCNGGLPSHSYEYIMYNNGLAAEVDYPYKGVDQQCAYDPKMKSVGVIGGSVNISVSETEIALALVEVGPVSVSFTVTDTFKAYTSGIFMMDQCPNGPLDVNHDVVAVGYGTENGVDFWVIKNSWGATWGEKGFFRIQRGVNMCGIANCGSYPQDIIDLTLPAKEARELLE